jgi:DnaJ-class molecular chaperone
MSALLNLHADVARELFLEYVIQQPGSVKEAARAAIEGANIFIEEYAARTPISATVEHARMKGCRVCFGSGGKVGKPCKACGGTGKVPA